MYCKKCGNKLQLGDRFCNQCGAKVEAIEETRTTNGFSPMFKREAEQESSGELAPKRNFHVEDFNWDLDGYPTEGKKKTEDIDFNWASVLDERDKRIKETRVPLYADNHLEEVAPETKEEPNTEKTDSVANVIQDQVAEENDDNDLQKTVRIDKFYTFNKKNEEFQALLDKEYERLKNGAFTDGDPIGEEQEPVHTVEEILNSQPESQDNLDEGILLVEEENEDSSYVGVVFADTPKCVIAFEGEETVVEKPAADEMPAEQNEATPSKGEDEEKEEQEHKLTFDDVFADDDDDIEKPKKKHTGLKILAIILCILVIAEVIVIALTFLAPESAATQWIISVFDSVKDLFSGSTPKG